MAIRSSIVAFVAVALALVFIVSPPLDGRSAEAQSRSSSSASPTGTATVEPSGERPVPSLMDLLVDVEWQGQDARLVFTRTGQVLRTQANKTEHGSFKFVPPRHLDIFMGGRRYYVSIRHISTRELRTQLQEQRGPGPIRQYQASASSTGGSRWADVRYEDGALLAATPSKSPSPAGDSAFATAVLGAILWGVLNSAIDDGSHPASSGQEADAYRQSKREQEEREDYVRNVRTYGRETPFGRKYEP